MEEMVSASSNGHEIIVVEQYRDEILTRPLHPNPLVLRRSGLRGCMGSRHAGSRPATPPLQKILAQLQFIRSGVTGQNSRKGALDEFAGFAAEALRQLARQQ